MNTFKTITAAELVSNASSRSLLRLPFVGVKCTRPREHCPDIIERVAQERRALLQVNRVLRRGALQSTGDSSEVDTLFLLETNKLLPARGSIQQAWSMLHISAWEFVSYATRRREGVMLHECGEDSQDDDDLITQVNIDRAMMPANTALNEKMLKYGQRWLLAPPPSQSLPPGLSQVHCTLRKREHKRASECTQGECEQPKRCCMELKGNEGKQGIAAAWPLADRTRTSRRRWARGLVREARHCGMDGDAQTTRWRDEEDSVMQCADVRTQFVFPLPSSRCLALGDIYIRSLRGL